MRSVVDRNVVMRRMSILILAMLFLPSENKLIIDINIASSITEKKYNYVLMWGLYVGQEVIAKPENK